MFSSVKLQRCLQRLILRTSSVPAQRTTRNLYSKPTQNTTDQSMPTRNQEDIQGYAYYATHILLAPSAYRVFMLLYMMKSHCNCIGKLWVSPPWKHAVLHLFFASKNLLPPNRTMWQTSWTNSRKQSLYGFDGKKRRSSKSLRLKTSKCPTLKSVEEVSPCSVRLGVHTFHSVQLSKYRTWILLLVQLPCSHVLPVMLQTCFHPMDGSPRAFHALEVLRAPRNFA